MTAQRYVIYYAPLFLILLGWQVALSVGLLSPSLVPSPVEVWQSLTRLFADADIFTHIGASLYRQMTGLILAIIIGVCIGLSMAHYSWAQVVFEPLVRMIYPLPKSALIPLLILWFGIGHASKVAAVFLGCLLPVVVSTYNGTRGVDKQLIWSAKSLGTSGPRLLWKVCFMDALPEIMSGVRIALALSYTLLISSEFLISRKGIGFLIQSLGELGDYAGMFAAVLIVALIGFFADRLYVAWMNYMLRWRGETE